MAKLSFYTGGRASPQQAPTRSPQGSFLLGETRGSGTAQSRNPRPPRPPRQGRRRSEELGLGRPLSPICLCCWISAARAKSSSSSASGTGSHGPREARPRPGASFTPSTGRRPLPCTLAADDDPSTCSGALHIYIYTHSSSNSTYHCSRV